MSIQDVVHFVVFPLLGLALLMAFVRLVRGPGLPDRVVAMELIATVGIAMLAGYAVVTESRVYFDVMLLGALISFLGTVAIAYSIERRVRR